MSEPSSPAHAPVRAMLEVLRAPLLLSPVADVLAGWTVAAAALSRAHPTMIPAHGAGLGAIAGAAAIGCCLLGAGMAQNALVDLPEDRLAKPQRPLPSGAIRPRTVAVIYMALTIGGLLLAVSFPRPVLLLAGAIVLTTIAYHVRLKRSRILGCLALGLLRAMDLLLGASACLALSSAGSSAAPWDARGDWDAPLLAAALYALYITGASLHASTDDEPETGRASRIGLLLAGTAMLLAAAKPAGAVFADASGHVLVWAASATLALFAALRLYRAARSLPPPAVTGVALSGLFLFDATVCLGTGRWPAAVLAAGIVMALFGLSRLALRVFPPT